MDTLAIAMEAQTIVVVFSADEKERQTTFLLDFRPVTISPEQMLAELCSK